MSGRRKLRPDQIGPRVYGNAFGRRPCKPATLSVCPTGPKSGPRTAWAQDTIAAWIRERVPGGMGGAAGHLLSDTFTPDADDPVGQALALFERPARVAMLALVMPIAWPGEERIALAYLHAWCAFLRGYIEAWRATHDDEYQPDSPISLGVAWTHRPGRGRKRHGGGAPGG